MHVLKPIISILLQHKFNIGRILQVGTVRIGEFDGPDPDRGPPFERRGPSPSEAGLNCPGNCPCSCERPLIPHACCSKENTERTFSIFHPTHSNPWEVCEAMGDATD